MLRTIISGNFNAAVDFLEHLQDGLDILEIVPVATCIFSLTFHLKECFTVKGLAQPRHCSEADRGRVNTKNTQGWLEKKC